jgi:hypothetical protein
MYLDFKNILRIKQWYKGACVALNSIVGPFSLPFFFLSFSFFSFPFLFFSFQFFPFFPPSILFSFSHFSPLSLNVMEAFPSLALRPPLGSRSGVIPRTAHDLFDVSLSLGGRSGAPCDVSCFDCAVLFF